MAIMTEEERNKLLVDIDVAIEQLFYENDALKAELTHAQSYKADAERYKELKKVICYQEGLSITLEYRDGDKKYANRYCFTMNEVKGSFNLSNQIAWQANWLWSAIENAITNETIDKAMKN